MLTRANKISTDEESIVHRSQTLTVYENVLSTELCKLRLVVIAYSNKL